MILDHFKKIFQGLLLSEHTCFIWGASPGSAGCLKNATQIPMQSWTSPFWLFGILKCLLQKSPWIKT
jgi:hypothetical protein